MLNKKVCILTSVHPVFDTRIFHKEAKTLVSSDYNVTLVAQHSKDEFVDKIKIIALPKSKNRFKRFIRLDYLTYKKALQQKADIYHFHDPELLPWMVKLKKKTGACVIYDVHEDVPRQILSKEYIPKYFKKIFSLIVEILENFWIHQLNFIITATDPIRERLVKHNPNITSIKNYISIKYIKPNKKYNNIFKIIFVGTIYKERGLLELIKALNSINDFPIELLLYGQVEKKFLAELYKKNNHKKMVKYGGLLFYTDVIKKIREANIGFICDYPIKRHMEGLPVKLFEYMAGGTPVICSNFHSWRKIVEDNNCGICVDPLNPKEMAEAIKYLIKHPNEAKKMGENGKKAILEKYNWENEAKKLLKIYKELTKC